MNRMFFSLILTLLFASGIAHASHSMASKVYCAVLGNEDASQEYKKQVYEALTQLGVEHPESVPVKQMNGVGPAFARMDLSSFTAFGIWLDEKYLDTCTQEEKLFHIYHEASHYACKHHQKILIGSAVSMLLVAAGLMKLSRVSPDGSVAKCVTLGSAAIAVLSGTYCYLLPHVVKRQEKQADLVAAQALINAGRQQVVDSHIDDLKESEISDNNIWWYSKDEQINYLENVRSSAPLK